MCLSFSSQLGCYYWETGEKNKREKKGWHGLRQRRGALGLQGATGKLLAEAISVFPPLQVCSSPFIPFTWRMAMTTS